MKKTFIKKVRVTFSFAISCLLFCIVILGAGCQKIPPEKDMNLMLGILDGSTGISDATRIKDSSEINYSIQLKDTVPLDELIVWRKPGSDNAAVDKWIQDSIGSYGKWHTESYCKNCDSSLRLIKGPGIRGYLMSVPPAGGGKECPGVNSSGGNGPCWVGMNYRASGIPRKITNGNNEKTYTIRPKTLKKIKVAVLDEGDNLRLRTNYPFDPLTSPPSCIPGGNIGWNFVARNSDTHDDGVSGKHGCDVTSYITERVEKYLKNDVEILTAKAFNKYESGSLFDICCAIAYASKREVKIMNCSFGFYLARSSKYSISNDPDVVFFKEFVKYYTTKNKILLVAAAGNKDSLSEHAAFKLRHLKYPTPPNDRDLRRVYFFPASFAEMPDFWNVIPITSVGSINGTAMVDPMQNFSPNIVYGVEVPHYQLYQGLNVLVFNNPRLAPTQTNIGSSFATAVASGVLCANYDGIEPAINAAKPSRDILQKLGPSYTTVAALNTKIKGGLVIRMKK